VAVMLRISKVRVCQLRDRALQKIRKSGGAAY
jgi:DNA-directed RNA polymerase specialized sigma subunit